MAFVEPTYQMGQYIRKILELYEDFNLLVDFEEEKTVTIKNYTDFDTINPKLDLANQEFWSHLEKIGAIKIVSHEKPKLIVYSVENLEDKFLAPAETIFYIKNIEKVKEVGYELGILTKDKIVQQRPSLYFDEKTSALYIKGKSFKIRRHSDQYDLLRVLFKDGGRLNEEWFFDEIAGEIDQYVPKTSLKKYYNAGYQINRKLAEKGIPEFFILNTHSIQITPHYLS